jgi:hypothetical protein
MRLHRNAVSIGPRTTLTFVYKGRDKLSTTTTSSIPPYPASSAYVLYNAVHCQVVPSPSFPLAPIL